MKDKDKAVMISDMKEAKWCDTEKIGIRDNNTLNTVVESLSKLDLTQLMWTGWVSNFETGKNVACRIE